MTGTLRRRRRLMAAGSLAGLACLFASLIPAPASSASTRATIAFTGSASVTPGLGYPVLGADGTGNSWNFAITNGVGLALRPVTAGAATGGVSGGTLRSGAVIPGAFCGASGGTGGSGTITITDVAGGPGATLELTNIGWLQSAASLILFSDNDGNLTGALVVGVVSAIPPSPVTGTGSCSSGTAQDFTIVGLATSL